MKTKRQIVIEQIGLQEQIQSLGFNIVECGNCGSILLHKVKVIDFKEVDESGECLNNLIDCFCGRKMSLTDCPDIYYSGIENNLEFDED